MPNVHGTTADAIFAVSSSRGIAKRYATYAVTAETLNAIVYFGTTNSRLKEYFDFAVIF